MNPQSNLPNFNDLTDDGWLPSFRVEDLWKMLSTLPAKATGSDGVPSILYRKSSLILAEPIYALILECFLQRRFPVQWKIADVVPILKSSNDSAITNTRPISLLPVPAKITERLVLDDLRHRLTECLGPHQYGIRRCSSTTHAIISVHDYLTTLADDANIGAAVFIGFDLTKAFDRISHHDLLIKLQQLGFPNGFLLLMRNYLYGRQQRIRLKNTNSDLKFVTSGVPQGSLLGPYLFGIYVASLKPLYQTTSLIKYVDDTCIAVGIRKSHALHDIQCVKSEIENISRWATQSSLSLNTAKTTGFVHYRGNFKDLFNITSYISEVNFDASVRFLGVMLSESLGWRSHVDFIERKCAQRMYILRRMRPHVTRQEFETIYNVLVRSLMEYASPAFIGLSKGDAYRLQVIQKRCLRIKGCTGVDPTIRRTSAAIKVFQQILASDTTIRDLLPRRLPSGRVAVPFCKSSLRRGAFFPCVCRIISLSFCD